MNRDEYAVLFALATLALLLAAGTLAFSHLEGWSLLDSLYFTVYTVTTVGYGDLTPSPENRLFTSLFIITCGTLTLACIAAIGNWIVSVIQRRSAHRKALRSTDRARRALSRLDADEDRVVEELDRIEEGIADLIRRI